MAVLQAAAASAGMPLWRYLGGDAATLMPLPEIQIFGGGAHAGRRVDIQDFLLVCPGAELFAQALDWTAEVYRHAGLLMAESGRLQGVADRSEEHTSELQSLMRISFAVFCLKKK